jgi:hypothetical protein
LFNTHIEDRGAGAHPWGGQSMPCPVPRAGASIAF